MVSSEKEPKYLQLAATFGATHYSPLTIINQTFISSCHFSKQNSPGLTIFDPVVYNDNRGYFFESFNENTFSKQGISGFVQDNQSFSVYGVTRGLHYQLNPYAQSKLVRALTGRISGCGG
jgi:dTDP-4-dehydrorhamnose 3,5-epimerase-like enzyme